MFFSFIYQIWTIETEVIDYRGKKIKREEKIKAILFSLLKTFYIFINFKNSKSSALAAEDLEDKINYNNIKIRIIEVGVAIPIKVICKLYFKMTHNYAHT